MVKHTHTLTTAALFFLTQVAHGVPWTQVVAEPDRLEWWRPHLETLWHLALPCQSWPSLDSRHCTGSGPQLCSASASGRGSWSGWSGQSWTHHTRCQASLFECEPPPEHPSRSAPLAPPAPPRWCHYCGSEPGGPGCSGSEQWNPSHWKCSPPFLWGESDRQRVSE